MDNNDPQAPGPSNPRVDESREKLSVSALDAMKAYSSSGEMLCVASPCVPPQESSDPHPPFSGLPFPWTPVPPPLTAPASNLASSVVTSQPLPNVSDIYCPEDSYAALVPATPEVAVALAGMSKKRGPVTKRVWRGGLPKKPRRARAIKAKPLPPPPAIPLPVVDSSDASMEESEDETGAKVDNLIDIANKLVAQKTPNLAAGPPSQPPPEPYWLPAPTFPVTSLPTVVTTIPTKRVSLKERVDSLSDVIRRLVETSASAAPAELGSSGQTRPLTAPAPYPVYPWNPAPSNFPGPGYPVPSFRPNLPTVGSSLPYSWGQQTQAPLPFLCEYQNPPHILTNMASNFSYGTAGGVQINERARMEIVNDNYVEMFDLLYPDAEQYSLTTGSGAIPSLSLKRKARRYLDSAEWTRAFGIYMSAYLLRYPHLTQQLLSYFRQIQDYMVAGINWQFYDHQFRKDRAITKRVWNEIRYDLYSQINTPNYPRYEDPNKGPSTSGQHVQRSEGQPQGPFVPYGFCIPFNRPNEVCRANPCRFKHHCPICKQGHPAFRHDAISSKSSAAPSSQSPATPLASSTEKKFPFGGAAK